MGDFEHDASFQASEASGHLNLDRYEDAYQQLYSEALEDGVITQGEPNLIFNNASAWKKTGLHLPHWFKQERELIHAR